MKTLIFYFSSSHKNTEKLLQDARKSVAFDLFNTEEGAVPDLSAYDAVGFASGIYGGKAGKPLLSLLEKLDLSGKKCFAITTSGFANAAHSHNLAEEIKSRGGEILGEFNCRGLITVAFFKLFGGIAKGRPNEADIANAAEFIRSLK